MCINKQTVINCNASAVVPEVTCGRSRRDSRQARSSSCCGGAEDLGRQAISHAGACSGWRSEEEEEEEEEVGRFTTARVMHVCVCV